MITAYNSKLKLIVEQINHLFYSLYEPGRFDRRAQVDCRSKDYYQKICCIRRSCQFNAVRKKEAPEHEQPLGDSSVDQKRVSRVNAMRHRGCDTPKPNDIPHLPHSSFPNFPFHQRSGAPNLYQRHNIGVLKSSDIFHPHT